MTDRIRRLIADAEEILLISICESAGGRLAYHDEGTRLWYWITLADLKTARGFKREEDADEEDEPCDSPYSHWCAATSAREVKTCETQLGLSLSCNCRIENIGRRIDRCANS